MKVSEFNTSVFITSGDQIKNGEERLVVLNRVARSVVDNVHGMHGICIHSFGGTRRVPKPLYRMNNTAWRSARDRAADAWAEQHGEPSPTAFRYVRVHDLKHTCGRRLRAAGVSFEDRQDLLMHRSSYHDALLPGGTHELDRSFGKGMRDRVPQNSRKHLASAQDRIAPEKPND